MQPRLLAFAAAFRSSAPANRGIQPIINARINAFVCRSCQRKFSTSPTLQWFGKSSKSAAKTVEKERSTLRNNLVYMQEDKDRCEEHD
jgi:hypothetical protein